MKMNLVWRVMNNVYVKGLRHELKAPELNILFAVDKIPKEKILILKAYIFPVKDTLY